MALTRCPRSGKLYDDRDGPVHPDHKAEEEADYAKVRGYLEENPDATHQEVLEVTGVNPSCMTRMLDQRIIKVLDEEERDFQAKRQMTQMEALRLHQKLDSEIQDIRTVPKKAVSFGHSVRKTIDGKRRQSP